MRPASAKTEMVEGHTSSIGALFGPLRNFMGLLTLKLIMRRQLRAGQFVSRHVQLSDGRIVHCFDSPGREDKPVLLVLPGATMSAMTTAVRCVSIVKQLMGHRVVVMELPHHGEHAHHTMNFDQYPWDQDSVVRDTKAFVDALGLQEPHDLLGFSFGGGVSALYLAKHPSSVRRAILLAPFLAELAHEDFADVLRAGEWNRIHAWETPEDMQHFFRTWLGMNDDNTPGRFMLNALYRHRTQTYPRRHFARFFQTIAERKLGDVGLLERYQAALRDARVPTLLLYGDRDTVCDASKMPVLADALGRQYCTVGSVASGHSFAERRGKGIFRMAANDICAFLQDTKEPAQRDKR